MDAARDPHLGIAEEPDEADVATPSPEGSVQSPQQPTRLLLVYVLVVLGWIGIVLTVAWNTEAGNTFVRHWWWLLAFPLGVAILVANAAGKLVGATIVIFVVLPSLIAGIALIAALPAVRSHSEVFIRRMARTEVIQPWVQPLSMAHAPQPWSAFEAQGYQIGPQASRNKRHIAPKQVMDLQNAA